MKLIVGLMVTLMIASSIALPVNNPSDDVENVEVLYPERNVEDIEPVYTSFLAPIPISPYSFFDSVEEYFRNIRQRVLSSFLDVADTIELDSSKGNSTSEIKVINGHRVEVNNTVYVDKNEDGQELFKVRVLHIRPLDLDDSTTTTEIPSNLNSDIDIDEKTVKPQAEGTTAEPEINNEIDQTKKPNTSDVKLQSELMSDDLTAIDDGYNDDDDDNEQQTTNLPTMTSALKISKENIQPLYYETKNDDNQNHNSNSDEEIELYQLNDSQMLESNNNNHNNDATKIHIEQIETTDSYTPTTIENLEIGISDIGNDNNINIKTDNNDVTKDDNDNDQDDNDDDTITPDTDDDDDDNDDENDGDDRDDDNNDNNEDNDNDTLIVANEETELDQTPTVDETSNNNIKDDIIDDDSNDDSDIIDKKKIINHKREHFESSEETNDLHTNKNIENFDDNGEWSTIQKDYNDDDDEDDNDDKTKENDNNENTNEKDNYNNEIDDYESIPIDLSNDINVNYIAKQNGVTPDPDAEFFLPNDLNNFNDDNIDIDYYNIKNFKKYEKLAKAVAEAAEIETGIDNNESKFYLAGEHDIDDDIDDSNESERKIPIK